MLQDVESWVRIKGAYVVNDGDLAKAVDLCYQALCWNKDKSGVISCDYNMQQIADVIFGYVTYFTSNPNKEAKYYYDEASDRSDPYRKALVERIALAVNHSPEFTNQVLSYLYWAHKQKKVNAAFLRPREADKFKDPDWMYADSIGGTLFKFSVELVNGVEKVFKTLGYVVENVAKGVENSVKATSFLLRNLPWIIGGVVVIGGVVLYKNSDKVEKIALARVGLSDGKLKTTKRKKASAN